MMTNVFTRSFSLTILVMAMSAKQDAIAQTTLSVSGSAGISDIEVNGLGIMDVVDPFIKPIAQYTAGLQYGKQLSPRLALVTGAQYASRGFGVREDININLFGLDLPVGARLETRLNYLEVPVMLKYNIVEQGVTPYVKAGVSTAYALNGKITPRVDALVSWQLPDIHINLENDTYNRWDVSAIAGAGISIPVNEYGSIQMEANYRHSLNDMFLDNITDIRIKSHGLSGAIGYSLRF